MRESSVPKGNAMREVICGRIAPSSYSTKIGDDVRILKKRGNNSELGKFFGPFHSFARLITKV